MERRKEGPDLKCDKEWREWTHAAGHDIHDDLTYILRWARETHA